MFLFSKRRRKRRSDKNHIYYILSVLLLSAGIISGYFNIGQDVIPDINTDLSGVSVFKFSFIKNFIFITLIYLNSFSLFGIPVCASLLILNGYMLTISLNLLYSSALKSKMLFIITNIPHLAFTISANILLAEVAFRFSKALFSCLLKNGNRNSLNKSFKELTFRFFVCVFFIFLSALYEGYVM